MLARQGASEDEESDNGTLRERVGPGRSIVCMAIVIISHVDKSRLSGYSGHYSDPDSVATLRDWQDPLAEAVIRPVRSIMQLGRIRSLEAWRGCNGYGVEVTLQMQLHVPNEPTDIIFKGSDRYRARNTVASYGRE